MSETVHQPVLLAEVVRGLGAAPGKHYVDATIGGGGHTRALLAATAPDGLVLGIDVDPAAIARLTELRTADPRWQRVTLVHGNLKNLAAIVREHRFNPTGGCLLDLGFSSAQVGSAERGFGFSSDRLDLRFDPSRQTTTAADLVNRSSAEAFAELLERFGEEPLARAIARAVVRERKLAPITSGAQLAAIVQAVYRRTFRTPSRRHPATRVFQALRIAVNQELENIEAALLGALEVLPPGSVLGVIGYHSLEDRISKQFFRQESRDCLCPPQFPRCACHHRARLHVLTPKPIRPQPREIAANPRSRSAKLRLARVLPASSADNKPET